MMTTQKRLKDKEKKKRNSGPLPTTTPTLPLSLPLNMNNHIHPPLPRQIIDAVPHVLEISVRRRNNVNHTTNPGFRMRRPVVVPVPVVAHPYR
jgi:hypothetical protein